MRGYSGVPGVNDQRAVVVAATHRRVGDLEFEPRLPAQRRPKVHASGHREVRARSGVEPDVRDRNTDGAAVGDHDPERSRLATGDRPEEQLRRLHVDLGGGLGRIDGNRQRSLIGIVASDQQRPPIGAGIDGGVGHVDLNAVTAPQRQRSARLRQAELPRVERVRQLDVGDDQTRVGAAGIPDHDGAGELLAHRQGRQRQEFRRRLNVRKRLALELVLGTRAQKRSEQDESAGDVPLHGSPRAGAGRRGPYRSCGAPDKARRFRAGRTLLRSEARRR
jgi:hypothetical protein